MNIKSYHLLSAYYLKSPKYGALHTLSHFIPVVPWKVVDQPMLSVAKTVNSMWFQQILIYDIMQLTESPGMPEGQVGNLVAENHIQVTAMSEASPPLDLRNRHTILRVTVNIEVTLESAWHMGTQQMESITQEIMVSHTRILLSSHWYTQWSALNDHF